MAVYPKMEGQKSTEDLAADVRQERSKRNISNSVLFLKEQVAEISQPISFTVSALTLHVTKLYISNCQVSQRQSSLILISPCPVLEYFSIYTVSLLLSTNTAPLNLCNVFQVHLPKRRII